MELFDSVIRMSVLANGSRLLRDSSFVFAKFQICMSNHTGCKTDSCSEQEARIRLAIEMLHGIEPTAEDLDSARTFIQSYKTLEGQANAETQAWSALTQV